MHKCGQRPMRPPKDIEQHSACNDDLLVIKLKDTDSVPEVYYRGRKLEGGFIDVKYHFHTTGDETFNSGGGTNDISIEGYDLCTGVKGKYPTIDTIKHERQRM